MQPYLFPYLGYFQLFDAADLFLVHDDVQYIKGGWINRNSFLCNGQPMGFTLPVKKDSSWKNINERAFADGFDKAATKLVNQLKSSYAKTPHLEPTLALVDRVLGCPERNVASFITHSLRCVVEHLGVEVEVGVTSEMSFRKELEGAERVKEIVRVAGGDRYVNATGGKALYGHDDFARAGLELFFLQPDIQPYPQKGDGFTPNLSILDALMFLGVDGARAKLGEYELVK